jgi:nucleoside-diphosphate-sugar epimerase
VKIFLTGGTGLVGGHVIAQLRARGDAILALARSDAAARALAALGAEVLRGDLGDAAILERGVAGSEATVHTAAIVLGGTDWPAFHAANVAPTEALAAIAGRHGTRLVHLSSVAVYGRRNTYAAGRNSVTEDFGLDQPTFPGDHYARSKREAELALWRVADATGLRAVALRPCVIYGEGDRQFSPRVAAALRIGHGVAPLPGRGDNLLSVVYAGNVAAAVLAALDHREAAGPYLVANDGGITLREFLVRFAAGLGVTPRFVPVPAAPVWHAARIGDAALRLMRPPAPMTTLTTAVQFLANDNPYSSARAERELGWRPLVPPALAAERTGRAFRRGTRPAP